jgi:ABC-2 type transport system permease protein/capsular polysaccharide transport system permease protein
MLSRGSGNQTGTLLGESPWRITHRVIGALLLRELLTRYGRNNIGFLWLFVEPMLFVSVVSVVWAATRKIHGSDLPIVAFSLTGYSSLLLWRGMPGRCIGALRSNRSLLYHRQVTILDVYLARVLLEFMAVSTSFVALGIAFWAMDWVPAPEDMFQVLEGWLLLGWFGAGLGLTIGGLSEKFQIVQNLWPPFSYILMPFSGVAYIADALPQTMRDLVLWLPMLNSLEFLREGWFGSQMRAHYDIPYVLIFNLLLTFVGLSLVRQAGIDTSEE